MRCRKRTISRGALAHVITHEIGPFALDLCGNNSETSGFVSRVETEVTHWRPFASASVTNRWKKAAKQQSILPGRIFELHDKTSFPNPDVRDASVVVDNEQCSGRKG
jgi:hypothetical protein